MGERIETVDFRHCKVKKFVKFEREEKKKKRYYEILQNNE